jgi:glycosyltransferase involved in cell wall biosynthesis
MPVGTPCIASAVGGVPCAAPDGIQALLTRDGDPYALAGALLRILSDTELAAAFGRRAPAVAEARRDSERIVARLLETYRVIISEAL